MSNSIFDKISCFNFPLEEYAYGKCHLFAFGLAESFDYKIIFFLDTDYWFEDAEYPSTVLCHAYCKDDSGTLFDCRGIITEDFVLDEYECNEPLFIEFDSSSFKEKCLDLEIDFPSEEEKSLIQKFIFDNINLYKKQ